MVRTSGSGTPSSCRGSSLSTARPTCALVGALATVRSRGRSADGSGGRRAAPKAQGVLFRLRVFCSVRRSERALRRLFSVCCDLAGAPAAASATVRPWGQCAGRSGLRSLRHGFGRALACCRGPYQWVVQCELRGDCFSVRSEIVRRSGRCLGYSTAVGSMCRSLQSTLFAARLWARIGLLPWSVSVGPGRPRRVVARPALPHGRRVLPSVPRLQYGPGDAGLMAREVAARRLRRKGCCSAFVYSVPCASWCELCGDCFSARRQFAGAPAAASATVRPWGRCVGCSGLRSSRHSLGRARACCGGSCPCVR